MFNISSGENIFISFYKNFKQMSNISVKLLLYGQLILAVVLLIIIVDITKISTTPEKVIENFYTYKTYIIFIHNFFIGHILLWGGAFFVDYLDKNRENL